MAVVPITIDWDQMCNEYREVTTTALHVTDDITTALFPPQTEMSHDENFDFTHVEGEAMSGPIAVAGAGSLLETTWGKRKGLRRSRSSGTRDMTRLRGFACLAALLLCQQYPLGAVEGRSLMTETNTQNNRATNTFAVVDDDYVDAGRHKSSIEELNVFAKEREPDEVLTPVFGGFVEPLPDLPEEKTPGPTAEPTKDPTNGPTMPPTQAPTKSPTQAPTNSPTNSPTTLPTKAPTFLPTALPTKLPTTAPTKSPTVSPTREPSVVPTTLGPTRQEPPKLSVPETVPPAIGSDSGNIQAPTRSPSLTPTILEPTAEPTLDPADTVLNDFDCEFNLDMAGTVSDIAIEIDYGYEIDTQLVNDLFIESVIIPVMEQEISKRILKLFVPQCSSDVSDSLRDLDVRRRLKVVGVNQLPRDKPSRTTDCFVAPSSIDVECTVVKGCQTLYVDELEGTEASQVRSMLKQIFVQGEMSNIAENVIDVRYRDQSTINALNASPTPSATDIDNGGRNRLSGGYIFLIIVAIFVCFGSMYFLYLTYKSSENYDEMEDDNNSKFGNETLITGNVQKSDDFYYQEEADDFMDEPSLPTKSGGTIQSTTSNVSSWFTNDGFLPNNTTNTQTSNSLPSSKGSSNFSSWFTNQYSVSNQNTGETTIKTQETDSQAMGLGCIVSVDDASKDSSSVNLASITERFSESQGMLIENPDSSEGSSRDITATMERRFSESQGMLLESPSDSSEGSTR
eukprot:scaffold73883_cov54-Attheya_sp.AAC.5